MGRAFSSPASQSCFQRHLWLPAACLHLLRRARVCNSDGDHTRTHTHSRLFPILFSLMEIVLENRHLSTDTENTGHGKGVLLSTCYQR